MAVYYNLVVSEALKASISQVWESEMSKITEPLFRPKAINSAKFFPTDACYVIVKRSFLEFFKARTLLSIWRYLV
jgi:hypothetical protein